MTAETALPSTEESLESRLYREGRARLMDRPAKEALAKFIDKALRKACKHSIPTCPLCRCDEWEVDNCLELREYSLGSLYANIYAVVPLACRNCACVVHLSAVRLGLIDPQTGKYLL